MTLTDYHAKYFAHELTKRCSSTTVDQQEVGTIDGKPPDEQLNTLVEKRKALTLEEKLAGQKQIKALEAQRNDKRRSLFDAQDKVDKQREDLIVDIEGKRGTQIHFHPPLENVMKSRQRISREKAQETHKRIRFCAFALCRGQPRKTHQ